MVAGLPKLRVRASYKSLRIRGQQVEEVARLALAQNNNQALAPLPELARPPPPDPLDQPLALASHAEPVVKAGTAPLMDEVEAEPDL
jgi:hypothetical protein